MKRRQPGLAVLVATVALLAGCSQVDSSAVRTSGMYADLSIESDGSGGSLARASLKVGGDSSNTYINLTSGDSLVTRVGTTNYPMVRQEALGVVWYQAIPPVDTANTVFRISLLRQDDAGAPASDVALPAPFSITAPAPGTAFSRTSQPIVVTWNGSGAPDALTWQVTGDCIVSQFGNQVSDTGTLTIPAGALQPRANQGATSCTAQIRFYRTRAGSVDPAYGEGGELRARQTRFISILSTP
jgi:hypothetical protein